MFQLGEENATRAPIRARLVDPSRLCLHRSQDAGTNSGMSLPGLVGRTCVSNVEGCRKCLIHNRRAGRIALALGHADLSVVVRHRDCGRSISIGNALRHSTIYPCSSCSRAGSIVCFCPRRWGTGSEEAAERRAARVCCRGEDLVFPKSCLKSQRPFSDQHRAL